MKPILLELPHSFETKRLLIRMPLPGDGAEVYKASAESKPELLPWMPWAHYDETLEDKEEDIRKAHLKFLERSDMRLHLYHKETGELVGCSGLHRLDWDVRKFEIGYWVRTKYQGQGLITEAVEGITKFAIEVLEANRVEIRCDKNNLRSAKVAERLGFTLEGILRSDSNDLIDNSLRDTMVFAKVRGYEF